MNKQRIHGNKLMQKILFLLLLLSVFLCGACTRCPKINNNNNREQAIAAYLEPLQEEISAYFSELTEEAAGAAPQEVRARFRSVGDDFLKAERKSLEELLQSDSPVLLIGIESASEKGFSEDEIRNILRKVKEQDIIVDLYFNYNDEYVYQVRRDGVMVDKATAKDGGAMRELEEYEL